MFRLFFCFFIFIFKSLSNLTKKLSVEKNLCRNEKPKCQEPKTDEIKFSSFSKPISRAFKSLSKWKTKLSSHRKTTDWIILSLSGKICRVSFFSWKSNWSIEEKSSEQMYPVEKVPIYLTRKNPHHQNYPTEKAPICQVAKKPSLDDSWLPITASISVVQDLEAQISNFP